MRVENIYPNKRKKMSYKTVTPF